MGCGLQLGEGFSETTNRGKKSSNKRQLEKYANLITHREFETQKYQLSKSTLALSAYEEDPTGKSSMLAMNGFQQESAQCDLRDASYWKARYARYKANLTKRATGSMKRI